MYKGEGPCIVENGSMILYIYPIRHKGKLKVAHRNQSAAWRTVSEQNVQNYCSEMTIFITYVLQLKYIL